MNHLQTAKHKRMTLDYKKSDNKFFKYKNNLLFNFINTK